MFVWDVENMLRRAAAKVVNKTWFTPHNIVPLLESDIWGWIVDSWNFCPSSLDSRPELTRASYGPTANPRNLSLDSSVPRIREKTLSELCEEKYLQKILSLLSALHVAHNIRSLQMAERISWLKNAAPFPSHGADRVGMWMRRRTQYQYRAILARRQDRENGEAIRVKMILELKYENW